MTGIQDFKNVYDSSFPLSASDKRCFIHRKDLSGSDSAPSKILIHNTSEFWPANFFLISFCAYAENKSEYYDNEMCRSKI